MATFQCDKCGAVSDNYEPVKHKDNCPALKQMQLFAKKFPKDKRENEY